MSIDHNNPASTVKPYGDDSKSKKQEVAEMFNNISKKYDLLNHLLSMGIDRGWRKKAIKILSNRSSGILLDVATGTADFAVAALKLNPEKIIGIDISAGMLEVGRKKIRDLQLDGRIELIQGDSEELPFADNTFGTATVAFGVRNFENLDQGLKEINRVLQPNGMLLVLEFSKPVAFPIKQIYNFYFKVLLPFIGKVISGDRSAYRYLPESVERFPHGDAFLKRMESAGFRNLKEKRLTFGIASIYTGLK